MAIYKVTATLSFEYDSEDGLATSEEEARMDMLEVLDSGCLGSDAYDVVVETVHNELEVGSTYRVLMDWYGGTLYEIEVTELDTNEFVGTFALPGGAFYSMTIPDGRFPYAGILSVEKVS